MGQSLPNYLRTYRKHSCLSQDELAYLLGCIDGTQVSRYERCTRRPNLENVLAFELIFGASLRELFAGTYEKVDKETSRRARALVKKLEAQGEEDPASERKLELLRKLAGCQETRSRATSKS